MQLGEEMGLPETDVIILRTKEGLAFLQNAFSVCFLCLQNYMYKGHKRFVEWGLFKNKLQVPGYCRLSSLPLSACQRTQALPDFLGKLVRAEHLFSGSSS